MAEKRLLERLTASDLLLFLWDDNGRSSDMADVDAFADGARRTFNDLASPTSRDTPDQVTRMTTSFSANADRNEE